MALEQIDECRDIPRPILAVAKEFSSGHHISAHKHGRSQFLYASAGVMTVKTNRGIWVVPPHRAVWIPANTLHEIEISGQLSMRTLYIDPTIFHGPSRDCSVITVSPLLRELVLHAMDLPKLYPLGGKEERVLQVLLDQITSVHTVPLELGVPSDSRLLHIYDKLTHQPGDNRTLDEWGKRVGATARTLARLFRKETGMSFGQWREQIRILEALRRLGMNEPVTSVAIELGYDSPSAFISMFKKNLGETPGKYFRKE